MSIKPVAKKPIVILQLLCLVCGCVVVSGCSATARKNWLGEFIWGVAESAAFGKNEKENRDFREPGLTRQEAKERYANYESYQQKHNSFLSDYKEKESAEQRERDAALLKGWLQQKESREFSSRDRSKDLF